MNLVTPDRMVANIQFNGVQSGSLLGGDDRFRIIGQCLSKAPGPTVMLLIGLSNLGDARIKNGMKQPATPQLGFANFDFTFDVVVLKTLLGDYTLCIPDDTTEAETIVELPI